jgi:hypothetical protein
MRRGEAALMQMATFRGLPRHLARRVAIYLYYTARPAGINPLSWLRARHEDRARAEIQAIPGLEPALLSMREKTRTTGCEWSDYLELYTTVRRLRPRAVLECGSGLSTCVIAWALRENGDAGSRPVFVSLEESDAYHAEVVHAFPDDLRPFVELLHRPRRERSYGGRLGCGYEDVPPHDYEFVFIDGPTLRSVPGGAKCFNADIVDIVRRAPGTVEALLDQRIGTLWTLEELMPGAAFRYDPVRKLTRIRADRHAVAAGLPAPVDLLTLSGGAA